MRLHERETLTRAASLDLNEVMLEWMRRHPELTYLERAMIMTEQTSVASEIKYALRIERHGTDEFPGGAEHTDEWNELNPYELRVAAEKIIGEDRVPVEDLVHLCRAYGPEPDPEEDGMED